MARAALPRDPRSSLGSLGDAVGTREKASERPASRRTACSRPPLTAYADPPDVTSDPVGPPRGLAGDGY
ncbi:hypothetical protein GCM10027596_03820 [Nocardioides korecus]